MKGNAILLCRCNDRTGIVATLTNFVAEYRGNIVDLDQHSDGETGTFFMRLVWTMDGFALDREELRAALGLVARRFDDMRWDLHFAGRPQKLALFCSKAPHCLADLLLRTEMGELDGEIALVVGNHSELEVMARRYGVPFRHVPTPPEGRAAAEAEQQRLLEAHGAELVVLARYMQILSPEFCGKWRGRVINIHHSFLPAFAGANPYRQAKARGVKVIGATAHYVTPELDQGAIIEQDVTRVSHKDSVEDLVRKGRDLERQVLARAVRLHLERRVLVENNRTVVFS